MAAKSKKKKKPWTVKKLEKATGKLASCVVYALKFLKLPGSGVVMNLKTGKTEGRWEEKFMKALDGIGYRVDRDKFWAQKR